MIGSSSSSTTIIMNLAVAMSSGGSVSSNSWAPEKPIHGRLRLASQSLRSLPFFSIVQLGARGSRAGQCPHSGLKLEPKSCRNSNFGSLRPIRRTVCSSAGVAPVGGGEDEERTGDLPGLLNAVPEEVVAQVGGKAGAISFYARESVSVDPVVDSVGPRRGGLWSLVWLLGPITLVASVVLPPLYLRSIFGAVLEDSLLTDFVILFFTETFFFIGASVFLYIAHISRVGASAAAATAAPVPVYYPLGYRLATRISLAIGVLLPVACFVFVWPWTGPAAAAALAPYVVGLLVQLGFEYITQASGSPVWPLVSITFQIYRLHQLNRAAQLVAGLLFSLKGVEATAETMAINGSLQTLLLSVQILGMLCLWSIGSFLTNQLPANLGLHSIPSLP